MSAAPTPSLQKGANDAPKGVPQDTLNIVLTAILLMLVITGCCWWLAFLPEDSYSCPIGMSDAPVRFYNLTMAVGASSLMIWHYLDPDALKVRYTVLGRPEFPVLHREFLGVQRWSTFTSWSNLSCTMFLCSAAILGFCGPEPPKALCMVNQVFWELTFPLAFFVNIVVSFVLIPQIKKMRDWQKLKRMLRLKPQLLHNGLAIAGAVEAMLATPPMKLSHFPVLVLFGSMYIVFAWYFFHQTGIFHYMFLDNRFKYEPLALVLLLILLAVIYFAGSVALNYAADSWPARLAIVVAALGTCTFGPGKVDPEDGSSASLLAS